jgi:hypothetical protein
MKRDWTWADCMSCLVLTLRIMVAMTRSRSLHLQYGPDDVKLPGTDTYPWPQGRPLAALESLISE